MKVVKVGLIYASHVLTATVNEGELLSILTHALVTTVPNPFLFLNAVYIYFIGRSFLERWGILSDLVSCI